jgi:hypothetical protein
MSPFSRMTPKQKAATVHYYRKFRGNMERAAELAWSSAVSHVYFMDRLGKVVKANRSRRRS